jgi:hypothetical protein
MVGLLERRDIKEVHSEQGGVGLVTVSGPTTSLSPFRKMGRRVHSHPRLHKAANRRRKKYGNLNDLPLSQNDQTGFHFTPIAFENLRSFPEEGAYSWGHLRQRASLKGDGSKA